MRICAKCGGGLKQGAGWEMSAAERAGSALEVDEFRCEGCGVRYLHRYEERFSGDIESWSIWSERAGGWELLDRDGWPTHGSAAAARHAPSPDPAPGPRFGEYALVWDRESGEFPERIRVLSSGETPLDFPDRPEWTGSVVKEQLEPLLNQLRARFPAPRFLALTIYGDDWAAASANFLSLFGSARASPETKSST